MIILTILLEIILIGLAIAFLGLGLDRESFICGVISILLWVAVVVTPILIGEFHGYINYVESNDKDKARITAVTQEQDLLKTYYKVEVEYLTNTPTQNGIITNYNIEKDTFYCYITDKELVEKLKNNMYKEIWIISGHKGGYETYKDFGTKLIKDIELIEETAENEMKEGKK